MHDLKWIRENATAFDKALARRNLPPMSKSLIAQDAARRKIQTELQEMQSRRNDLSKQIGVLKGKGESADSIMAEVAGLKDSMHKMEMQEREETSTIDSVLAGIPNILDADVPEGRDESANIQIRESGTPPKFDFAAKDHVALGEGLGMMDFEAAAKLSGARFVILKSSLARLERALAAFKLDTHTQEFSYQEIYVPQLVRSEALFGTGQLPKFGEDLFRTQEDFWLIPTAEVALTNLVADDILSSTELPLRFTAYTSCFRSEAGAAGKDTRGMIRQHQFGKVELVSITHPDESQAEHERMTDCAEEILKRLGLAYRTMILCSGDTGFSAQKTYDIEVWLPGQNTYREISSCSNCGDFQARRMKARFKEKGGKGTQFVHTLNGSGLAVGRALIAVLENYQKSDGSIEIPPILRPYMNGQELITPNNE